MGAGLSSAGKVRELQGLDLKEGLSLLLAAGVPKADANKVLKRIKAVNQSGELSGEAVACLMDGVSTAGQDALALLALGKPVSFPKTPVKTHADKDPWEDQKTKEKMLRSGWCAPGADLDDGPTAVGHRVYVDGYGEGLITGFSRAKLGASSHIIEFDAQVASASTAVKLRRKGNSETRWLFWPPGVPREDVGSAKLSLLVMSTGSNRPKTPPWAKPYKQQPAGLIDAGSQQSSSLLSSQLTPHRVVTPRTNNKLRYLSPSAQHMRSIESRSQTSPQQPQPPPPPQQQPPQQNAKLRYLGQRRHGSQDVSTRGRQSDSGVRGSNSLAALEVSTEITINNEEDRDLRAAAVPETPSWRIAAQNQCVYN